MIQKQLSLLKISMIVIGIILSLTVATNDLTASLLSFPLNSSIVTAQSPTYQFYFPLVSHPPFQVTHWSTTGPAFAVPATDEQFIYVGSGFGSLDCATDIGEIRAFDKDTLGLYWKSEIQGAVGDTTIILIDGLLIFGAGDGVAAINTQNGSLSWQLDLGGCFQESFIRLDNDHIFVGSSDHTAYSISKNGQVSWRQVLKGAIFAAPAIHESTVYFVDESSTLAALQADTGQILWQKTLPVGATGLTGIFAGPLIHNNKLYVATYGGDVLQMTLSGDLEATHSTTTRYIASPSACNDYIVAANLDGQVDWLDPDTLTARYSITLPGQFLFGTPQCIDDIVIVTTYGVGYETSILYYLQDGVILKAIDFDCCHRALPTTVIDDDKTVFNVLTTYSGQHEASLARSRFAVTSP